MSGILEKSLTKQDLVDRRAGLGGSDAAAALGLSKWTTPLELWEEKLGQSEPAPASLQMRVGTQLEPLVRDLYEVERQTEVRPCNPLTHSDHPWMLARPDGYVADEEIIFEAKTARSRDGWGMPWSDAIPVEYELQVRHYMAVVGVDRAHVAVLFGNNDFQIYELERDLKTEDLMIAEEQKFWERVITGSPPEVRNLADCRRAWPKSDPALKSIEVSKEVSRRWKELKAAREDMKLAKGDADECEMIIKEAMEEYESATYEGETIATWKSAKDSLVFDWRQFAADNPDLIGEYMVTRPGSRRFLVK
jgi:putative phage-type endonuclease